MITSYSRLLIHSVKNSIDTLIDAFADQESIGYIVNALRHITELTIVREVIGLGADLLINVTRRISSLC